MDDKNESSSVNRICQNSCLWRCAFASETIIGAIVSDLLYGDIKVYLLSSVICYILKVTFCYLLKIALHSV